MNSDDDRKAVDGSGKGAPADGDFDARLARLRSSLDERAPKEPQRADRSAMGGMGQALRLGSEFVAGVIVGFVIGYGIDQVFGTTPWGMIVFLLLGFAAGTLNVMRSAGLVAPAAHDRTKQGDGGPKG